MFFLRSSATVMNCVYNPKQIVTNRNLRECHSTTDKLFSFMTSLLRLSCCKFITEVT